MGLPSSPQVIQPATCHGIHHHSQIASECIKTSAHTGCSVLGNYRTGVAAYTMAASIKQCQGHACAASPTHPSGQRISSLRKQGEQTSEAHLTGFQVSAMVLKAVPGSLQRGSLCSRRPVVHSRSLLLVHCLLAGLQQPRSSALLECGGDPG